jgi:hypothetical protein
MHDQELLRRAQYDQDNGPPDDLYVIPADHAPSASPGAVNNFSAFSRRLRAIRYPKDFKPSIEKYDGVAVKFCQPSHEFTFGVGMTFVSYPLVLTPVV